jgi:Fe-S oxidoreductase
VVLEPACAAVFRDELINLFPSDGRARRLSELTSFFDEFLDRHAQRLNGARLERKTIVHAHCQQKALVPLHTGAAAMGALGMDFQILDSGCCGMAGSFGFEAAKYSVSKAIGELAVWPAVRGAPTDAVVIADGFSCRDQIAHGTGRRALHLAQAVALALHPEQLPARGRPPETHIEQRRHKQQLALQTRSALLAGAVVLAGVGLVSATRKLR